MRLRGMQGVGGGPTGGGGHEGGWHWGRLFTVRVPLALLASS
jgi:hypothetical protein